MTTMAVIPNAVRNLERGATADEILRCAQDDEALYSTLKRWHYLGYFGKIFG